ncbi:TonB-dependent receptor [Sphingomonas sp.]|uniref:TonB-dependent receptor n=1 Tax=Sphingomonas sp. TaxID=28214 RepID=UPI003B3B3E24
MIHARTILLLGGATIGLCVVAVPAAAQVRRFDIPAQAASTGIPMFAHQAGIQILAPGAITNGVTLNGLQGSMDVPTALRTLLSGTDLTPVAVGQAIILRRRDTNGGALKPRPLAFAQAAQPAAAPQEVVPSTTAPIAAGAGEGDEVVVTGIRASLQQSIATKRAAGNIADVISAQDIGKLPDQNVAESLSRITGVQISRREGEGSNFTVRGISQNRLEINGRTYLGPTANGTPALETLSPEILSSIVVSKTPSADMPEGALGATVNLKTKRPLELADLVVSGRVQGAYTDQADKAGLRTSALVSKNFDDRFGVLASLAYTKLDTLGYSYDSGGWTRTDNIDGNGDGVADPGLFRPNRIMARIYDRRENRLTANGTAQWRPTDTLEFIVDGTYSRLSRKRNDTNYQVLLNDNDVDARADANGTVVSGTFNGVTLRPLIYDEPTKLQTTNFGASGKYEAGRLRISVDGSYSKAKGTDGGPGASFVYVVVPRAGNITNASYNFVPGHLLPDLSLNTNFNRDDPAQYRLNSVFDSDNQSDNTGYDARIDGHYDLDFGPLKSVETGFRYEHLSLFGSYPQNTPGAAALLATGDKNGDGIIGLDELPGVQYDRITSKFYPGASANFPRQLLTGTANATAARDGLNLPTLDPYAAITVGVTSIANIKQETTAEYVKANFGGDLGTIRYSGNAGLRFLSTSRTSSGYLAVGTPTSATYKFNYVLPSANVKFDFTDDLSLRLAAAKVVARPNIGDVSVSFVPNTVSFTGSRGNPGLRPFEAKQYDASLEWYFAPASSLTAALFKKDVNSFTVNTVTQEFIPGFSETYGLFNISQPTNGENGTIKGFEVGYQQTLRFLPGILRNLGVQANYTYVDSRTPLIDPLTARRLPLPGLSKNNYNLIAFYEDGLISARVAYTFRDKYLIAVQSAASGGSLYQASTGQLDASAQINLTKSVRLIVEGVNLNKSVTNQYLQYPNRLFLTTREDRRLFFGVAATF